MTLAARHAPPPRNLRAEEIAVTTYTGRNLQRGPPALCRVLDVLMFFEQTPRALGMSWEDAMSCTAGSAVIHWVCEDRHRPVA